jgi:hypothetical protein
MVVEDSSVNANGGVTVEYSRSAGIGLSGASNITLRGGTAAAKNIIQNNCANGIGGGAGNNIGIGLHNEIKINGGAGIGVGNGASVNLSAGGDDGGNPSTILIQGNAGRGIDVGPGATLNISATANPSPSSVVIEDNGGHGIGVTGPALAALSGNVIVEKNSTDTNPDFVLRAGILVRYGGTLFLNPGSQVINNSGPGIWADVQSKVGLGSPFNPSAVGPTITGNSQEGVRLEHMSIAQSGAGVAASGNGGADLTCDGTSLLFGSYDGIVQIKCAHKEKVK